MQRAVCTDRPGRELAVPGDLRGVGATQVAEFALGRLRETQSIILDKETKARRNVSSLTVVNNPVALSSRAETWFVSPASYAVW